MTYRDASLATDDRSPIADPGSRAAAALIDTMIPMLPVLVALPLGVAFGSGAVVQAGMKSVLVAALVVLTVNVVLLARSGQTIGKRALGLRILRSNGERASLGRVFFTRSVLATALSMVPLIGWLFALGDLLAVFSADRRTLHDRLADTIVVDLRAPVPEMPAADVFA